MNIVKEKKTITNEMIVLCYAYAKKIYNREIEEKQAVDKINRIENMNPGSAKDYITAFFRMIEGEKYIRTINIKATKYYLENIRKDFGENTLNNAIKSVEKHIAYYENGHGSLKSIKQLLVQYK